MSYNIAKAEASAGGIGVFGLMFIVMFALKLGGIIDISWWLVTAPLWAPATVFLVVLLGFLAWLVYMEYKK